MTLELLHEVLPIEGGAAAGRLPGRGSGRSIVGQLGKELAVAAAQPDPLDFNSSVGLGAGLLFAATLASYFQGSIITLHRSLSASARQEGSHPASFLQPRGCNPSGWRLLSG